MTDEQRLKEFVAANGGDFGLAFLSLVGRVEALERQLSQITVDMDAAKVDPKVRKQR